MFFSLLIRLVFLYLLNSLHLQFLFDLQFYKANLDQKYLVRKFLLTHQRVGEFQYFSTSCLDFKCFSSFGFLF
jgi:hypothetical protein